MTKTEELKRKLESLSELASCANTIIDTVAGDADDYDFLLTEIYDCRVDGEMAVTEIGNITISNLYYKADEYLDKAIKTYRELVKECIALKGCLEKES